MKRDPELIRQLLLLVEAKPMSELPMDQPEVEGFLPEDVAEHIRLAHEAGYVEAGFGLARARRIGNLSVFRLTNEGHDFLDAVRNDTVWNKTKEEIERGAGAASLEVWKEVAIQLVRATLFSGWESVSNQ